MWYLGHHGLHSRMNGGCAHLQFGIETEQAGYVAVEVLGEKVVLEKLVGIASHHPCLRWREKRHIRYVHSFSGEGLKLANII